MRLLSLETSTKCFSLAVTAGDKVLCCQDLVLDKVLADAIVPAIRKILEKAKVPLAKIDGFAVGLGPGSFTSLRVGVATVKALAFATQKPIVGIPSLDVIALNVAQEKCDEICVIVDARRDLVYSALYKFQAGKLKRTADPSLTSLPDVLDKVKGRTLFIGDGIVLYREEIERLYAQAAAKKPTGCQPVFSPEKFWYPQAENLAKLALPRFAKKKYDEANKLVPLYLYPMDCQVQKRA